MVSVLPETHPHLFEHDNIFNSFDTTGLYGIKDPREVSLINTYLGSGNQFLRISINRCQVECASDEIINSFLESHSATMFQSLNYIDYEDVEAVDGYVKTTLGDIEASPLPT